MMAAVAFNRKCVAFFSKKSTLFSLVILVIILWILTPNLRGKILSTVQFVEPVFQRNFNRVASSKDEFCVVSYNILFDPRKLSSTVRQYLPLPREELLKKPKGKKSKRHLQMMKEIRWLQPDIINLQEVELFYYPILVEEFRPAGFESVYIQHHNKSSGVAIFYNKKKFKKIKTEAHSFHELLEKACSRDVYSEVSQWYDTKRVVKFLLLEARKSRRQFVIGNAHLMFARWNFPDAHALQISLFFQELHRFLSSIKADASLPWVFTGDFNTYPHFPVYDIISTGKASEESLKKLNPFKYKYPQVVKKKTVSDNESIIIKGCREKLSNPIKDTRSAYKTILGEEPPLTHYQIDSDFQKVYGFDVMKGTLDYIWYSGKKLGVNAVLEPVKEEVIKPLIACPNQYFPSDHMSLKACFRFK